MAKFNIELSVTGSESLRKSLGGANTAIKSLGNSYDSVVNRMREAEHTARDLEGELVSLNKQLSSGTISQNKYEKEVGDVRNALASARQAAQQYQARLTSLKATTDQNANSSKSLGTATKNLQAYSNDYTSGIRSANAVSIEFSRIIQDAPYGIQGVANNVQQLTQNWAYYSRAAKEAAAAQGQTIGTAGLLRGALGAMLNPVNLLTLSVSAITAGWVAYERWQQRAAKASRETVDEIQELIQGLNNLSTALYEGAKSSGAEIAELQVLYTTIRDGKQAYDTRINAVKQIQEQYPAYFKNLSQEQILTGQASAAYRELRKDILSAAQAQAAYGRIGEKTSQQFAIDEANKSVREQIALLDERIKKQRELTESFQGEAGELPSEIAAASISREAALLRERSRLQRELNKNLVSRAGLQEDINGLIDLGVSLQKNQVVESEKNASATKKTVDIIEKITDSLRSMRQDSILTDLKGLNKTIQSIRFQYDAIERSAADFGKQNEDAFNKGTISAQKYQENLSAIEAYLVRISGFEVGAVGRAIKSSYDPLQSIRRQNQGLNLGQGQVVQRNIQQPYVSPKVDWSDFENGLKRATNRFVRDFTTGLDRIAQDANYKIGGILAGLGTNIVNAMLPVFQNFFSNKLEGILGDAFDNLSKRFGESSAKSMQAIAAGAGVLGGVVSQVSRPTSAAGQGIGGALSGAAAGLSFGPIGAVVGGVIGAISGIVGANRRRRLEEEQLAEQKKQTALMERAQRLAFTSSIIGQQTNQGIITGVDRNAFGDVTFRIQGRDLVATLSKEESANVRGL